MLKLLKINVTDTSENFTLKFNATGGIISKNIISKFDLAKEKYSVVFSKDDHNNIYIGFYQTDRLKEISEFYKNSISLQFVNSSSVSFVQSIGLKKMEIFRKGDSFKIDFSKREELMGVSFHKLIPYKNKDEIKQPVINEKREYNKKRKIQDLSQEEIDKIRYLAKNSKIKTVPVLASDFNLSKTSVKQIIG